MGRGFLVPERFVRAVPSDNDMNLASICWGLTLGLAIFSFGKGFRQSWQSAKRGHPRSAYIIFIWMEWTASVIISVISWCYLRNYIGPSFQYFFITLCLWTIQVQVIMQIIINRIQCLMVIKKNATRLKWAVFLIMALVNISVFIIWIPARLQISDRWVHINEIWDRCEKGIFALIDCSLNLYFIYLVRANLIAYGLTKYIPLFRFNISMIAVSMSTDFLIIGMMSLPTSTIYVQFHPLAYLVKLYIEMNMAELIAKVVKASNPTARHSLYGSRNTDPSNNVMNTRRSGCSRSIRPSTIPPGGIGDVTEEGFDPRLDAELDEIVKQGTREFEVSRVEIGKDCSPSHQSLSHDNSLALKGAESIGRSSSSQGLKND